MAPPVAGLTSPLRPEPLNSASVDLSEQADRVMPSEETQKETNGDKHRNAETTTESSPKMTRTEIPFTPPSALTAPPSNPPSPPKLILEAASVDSVPIITSMASEESVSKSVTVERKKQLLLQARKDRISWIQQAALPYRVTLDAPSPSSCGGHDERLLKFRRMHANEPLPSAWHLLSHLCGDEGISVVAERLETLFNAKEATNAFPTGQQLLRAEMEGEPSLRKHFAFLQRLQDPIASTLVQNIRTFCRAFADVHSDSSKASARVNAFCSSTFSGMKTLTPWKDMELDTVQHSLETFVYAHCNKHLEELLWNDDAKTKDTYWRQRMASLHFVTPEHLEIDCLVGFTREELKTLLKEPIECLSKVDSYFSPFDKLQLVLGMYRGVNVALSSALNQSRDGEKKLPSADDVLPTIILVVLFAEPVRLLFNLDFCERFSAPEYIRGEAGYAFTNLYGATQFLENLDLVEPKSLAITADDFRRLLASSREAMADCTNVVDATGDDLKSDSLTPPLVHIPVPAVREAREKGETVDDAWACKWYEANEDTASLNLGMDDNETILNNPTVGLPAGFTRSYTYLHAQPEDVRLVDLPELLAEYRVLVQTTETLIAERVSRSILERKQKRRTAATEVYSRVQEVDASLLPARVASPKRSHHRGQSSMTLSSNITT